MKFQSVACFFALLGGMAAAETIDLAGEWRFALDPKDHYLRAGSGEWHFAETIRLPGMLTAQGFGDTPSFKTVWTGDGWRYPELFTEWQTDENFKFPFFLQPPRHYVGPAWFEREVDLPADWTGFDATLHLERVHWQSVVFVDGREAGRADSLGTSHEFDLGRLAPGRHRLTLRIDNRLAPVNVGSLSHSVTDHTQGNWNGVVGRIELRRRPASRIESVQIFPSLDRTTRVVVAGRLSRDQEDSYIEIGLEDVVPDVRQRSPRLQRREDGRFEVEMVVKLADRPKVWDEFSPRLHRMVASLYDNHGARVDSRVTSFGVRQVGSEGGRITLNGRKIFLRGTLECAIFPLTGHPPTDVESWRRIIRICKAHGLNHIRFHSWCPPEAAFVAADELGFYYQVEVSSWANRGTRLGSGDPLDEWLEAESKRMLAAYGNHPSFLMMAYGNEPGGPNHVTWLEAWVARRKAEDSRRLYTTGAGWPVRPGSDFHSSPKPRIQAWGEGLKSIINAEPPRTDFDWSGFVSQHADAPVVSHEIGQWCVYPNFDEIPKYTGYFKARNFEIFQETARRNGLLPQVRDFLRASGRLQVLAYKHDIEAALRTPGFGGFQLLDLHDFPGQGTALVGVLDAFWDGNGYINAGEYRRFCGPMVPLARLRKMVFTTRETLEAELELAQFGPADLTDCVATWTLASSDGAVIASGRFPPRNLGTGELHRLGSIAVPLATVVAPAKLTLTVQLERADVTNSWEVFVYPPQVDTQPSAGVVVTSDLDAAKNALARGGRVLWMPPSRSIVRDAKRPLVAGFSPMFWNTAWTNWQPPHTLGILCDPAHPGLGAFPTEGHSNWQWWEIQQDARPFILTRHAGLQPMVQAIDDWVTNRKLGYIFEARVGDGRLIACGSNLTRPAAGPVSRQLLASLLAYMKSDRFAPANSLAPKDVEALVEPLPLLVRLGATASATSAEPRYPADAAIDGDRTTIWHSEFGGTPPKPPHDFTLRFADEIPISAVLLTQRQDRNVNGQVADVEIIGDGRSLARVRVPMDVADYRIPFSGVTRVKTLIVRTHSSHARDFASLAEVEIETQAR